MAAESPFNRAAVCDRLRRVCRPGSGGGSVIDRRANGSTVRILFCALLAALAFTAFQPVPYSVSDAHAQRIEPTASPILFVTNTPHSVEIIIPTATPSPTAAVLPTNPPTQPSYPSPTPGSDVDANGTPVPTWTPPPLDPAVQIADHYHFQRPISDQNVNYADRTYPYGGTSGGALQVHHGVDLVNPNGTLIMAAGDGTVYYAGDDLNTQFGLSTNYYGNLVVIQHDFLSPAGQPVFTLYGHMKEVRAQTGQRVSAGDVIGVVGATGVAFGPHLHFEVRLGDPHDFNDTRNPDLWIYPYRNFGTLAGRITDANGNLLYQATIQVRSTKSRRYTFSYADNSVHGDDSFGENYTLGDLPAGYYEVSVNDGQRVRFLKMIYVYPNITTWLNIQLN
jgi:murein DD-endopeptidase MepM/ murein hydrolase activator NlpD